MTNKYTLYFPWFSSSIGLGLIAYYYASQALTELALTAPDIQQMGWALLFVSASLILDLSIFHRRRKTYEAQLDGLRDQVEDLLQTKKQLQNKIHTYSGHTDKLKMFISDRLLEHIEYDEKFLHFRSIAAEIRHNGVISFDKVQTALKQAIEHQPQQPDYQVAVNSMVYLWDLLDLSTTDNIALHVANYICECEEIYYQSQFEQTETPTGPFTPSYSAQQAALQALKLELKNPVTELNGSYYSNNETQFFLQLEDAGELLGKQNHFILLLENLIKNALFYSNKKSGQSKYKRVAVSLKQQSGLVWLEVYNRGAHIQDKDKDQIYQLGYSTRRSKDHHGQGLGLYFVQQLVKGYEGSIRFDNINNSSDIYALRIALADGEIISDVIKTDISNVRPLAGLLSTEQLEKTLSWKFSQAINSIEIAKQGVKITHTFQPATNSSFSDPLDPAMPRWVIEVQKSKTSSKLEFIPLDVCGVRFTVKLPTAQLRLDGDHAVEIDEQHLAQISKPFD